MNNRDIVSQMAIFDDLSDMVMTFAAPFDLTSDAVDTKGMYAIAFALSLSRALVAADIAGAGLTFTFEDSDDNVTFNALPSEGTLPSRLQPPNNKFVIQQNGFKQVIGCFSARRYVRVKVAGQVDASDVTLVLRPLGAAQVQEFTDYDAAAVPSDGLP